MVLTKHILFLTVLLFALEISLFATQAADGESGANPVVAVVDGTPITFAQFEQKRPSALFQARNTFYEAEKKAVDAYLDDYLLERQAQKEKLTVDKLLEKHVNSTIAPDPDDTALRVYYEGLDTTETFEAMKGKILDHLRERRIAKVKLAYVKSLRTDAKITLDVAVPRAQVSLANTPVRGTANGPITLVEYADFECPYCQQFEPDLDRLQEDFKGKLTFAYKDVPLPMHGHAQKAAEAAHCAGAQNKFWEYHDLLLKTKELEIPQLKAGAQSLGLDASAFNKCLDSGAQADIVKASLEEAGNLGLTGTPSFFLNGRFFAGTMSYEQLRGMVDDELKAVTNQPQPATR